MSEESDMLTIGGILILGVLLVLFLITPHTGNIAGYPITMPGIAWVGIPVFAILALYLYFRYRA